ncbi:matrixin family metalloprotease [Nocardioides aequoreus]|uniref:matrixin family metalloprotease n=1 Tax=Nocardioides aequoreus TaxID=397278 RepID=UPI00068B588D|nr:matrixin family metalloprotease [Nocardioides aequoreus]
MTSTGPSGGRDRTRRARDERGAGGLRNVLVTLLTVGVVAGLALFVPGLLPPVLRTPLSEPVGQPPPADAGGAPDTPVVRTDDGGTYRFAAVQRGSEEPVTYSSCEPIAVEVNVQGAPEPESALRMVLDGMDRISEATGLVLEYAGPSDRRPEWERGEFTVPQDELDDPPPVLVSFADAAEVPQLQGQVAGIAGSVVVAQGGVRRYLTGQVTLDTESFGDLAARRDGDEVAAAITLHELGHLVGLDHVDDSDELMHAVTTDQRDFGPGDREGLRRLGGGPC